MEGNHTPSRVLERIKVYGRLGEQLIRRLTAESVPLTILDNLSITDQLITTAHYSSKYAHDPLIPAAISLLLSEFPVQVPMSSTAIVNLCQLMFDTSMPEPDVLMTKKPLKALMDKTFLMHAFPFKYHPAATSKTNVRLSGLCQGLQAEGLLKYYGPMLASLAYRVSDDQACGAVLYATGLAQKLGPYAYTYATKAVLYPKDAKILSTALKALGCNSDMSGALLVEADTLQGRGVGTVDLYDEARYRCDQRRVDESVVHISDAALISAIDDVLREEIDFDKVAFEDLSQFWSGRWAWCVNGSHSRVLDRQGGLDTRSIFPGVDRVYRRMYAEAQESEPISDWDGHVYVSASEKLEHGKTRSIFACDTVSYFGFEHLLNPIERAWRGRRVILDPGSQGHYGVARRILKLRADGGVNVMLDYDDFNSAHATRTMQLLFQRLCALTGYPPGLADRLIGSFDKEHIYCRGKLIGLAKGTLMSGHRGTTFINSVLNAVYVRVAVGRATYESYKAVHVGDDIYICVPTHADAALLLTRTRDIGCRMNPMKQSVGTVGAEFLRMGIRSTHAVGYFARAVASAVSGNWVTESQLSPRDALRTAIATTHTLENRSGVDLFSSILSRPLARLLNIKLSLVRGLLSGSIAVEGSPQFRSDGSIRTVAEVMPPPEIQASALPPEWPHHATEDYLTTHAAAVEQYALKTLGRSAVSAMLVSSYSKTLASELASPPRPRYVPQKPRLPVGSTSASVALLTPRVHGVLEAYPILQLMRNVITKDVLRELLAYVGADPNTPDLELAAWGPEHKTRIVQGALSYADAASLSNHISTDVLYTAFPIHM